MNAKKTELIYCLSVSNVKQLRQRYKKSTQNMCPQQNFKHGLDKLVLKIVRGKELGKQYQRKRASLCQNAKASFLISLQHSHLSYSYLTLLSPLYITLLYLLFITLLFLTTFFCPISFLYRLLSRCCKAFFPHHCPVQNSTLSSFRCSSAGY